MFRTRRLKGRKSNQDIDILVAIRRFESHNGIAMYLLRLAKHLNSRSTSFDLLLGELKRVPGTERAFEELVSCADEVTICDEVDPKNAVYKISWKFLFRLIKRCLVRTGVPLV